ncbi:MAG TPA: hypothetical protein PL081_06520, partial [Pseudomonadales bacterium]|nr:hypothetical protein [Pseudomonadales bacterium]
TNAAMLATALWLAAAAPALAQGMGLLDRKSDAPIEIEADDGIEWRQADNGFAGIDIELARELAKSLGGG